MSGWQNFGSIVSDPWPDSQDSQLWKQLLAGAVYHDAKLYVKLIGLRCAGAELQPDERFGHRLVMANNATVTQQDARELLAPHARLFTNLILHLEEVADGQQETYPRHGGCDAGCL